MIFPAVFYFFTHETMTPYKQMIIESYYKNLILNFLFDFLTIIRIISKNVFIIIIPKLFCDMMKGKIIAMLVSFLLLAVVLTGISIADENDEVPEGEYYGEMAPAPNAGDGDPDGVPPGKRDGG